MVETHVRMLSLVEKLGGNYGGHSAGSLGAGQVEGSGYEGPGASSGEDWFSSARQMCAGVQLPVSQVSETRPLSKANVAISLLVTWSVHLWSTAQSQCGWAQREGL